MSRFLMTLLCLLSALNVIALILNLSQVTRAAVGGMSDQLSNAALMSTSLS